MKLVKDINKESSNKPQVSDKEAEEAIKKLLTWIGFEPISMCIVLQMTCYEITPCAIQIQGNLYYYYY